MHIVKSKDGTKIAYEKIGNGPAVILVAPAVADHTDAVLLAERLSMYFTVYNYDRRGRGKSTDSTTYAVEREVEDIEAIIQEAGGKVHLFGSSSGAVLALEATSKLGNKVNKLFLFEPPFIINDGRVPVSADYVQHLNKLILAEKRSDAVEYFMTEAIGIPAEYLEPMKADPSWEFMKSMAHKLAYDGLVMSDTQSGKPLPTDRWNVDIPTLVMTGENSEPFLHDGARAIADLLQYGEHRILSGQDHSVVMMAPDVMSTVIKEFFIQK
ncbi:alpha/beta fold hydrolase [Cytobacillus purgationiresistens]|uniref:Pimeloyl-ACP methyl ester carboxylesterase n=1 Tax=Cytobacillus purgationiresistens TaxID=863449 RepID=A0ABU0AEX6_9BACI|nr:alpha/beta hydrolase [Cytobacillus purgationiresistens]MDQ0268640.1 pimeloyl-ACP methyl ester carboxylesterase [Cytobacillus purgationiresistens]